MKKFSILFLTYTLLIGYGFAQEESEGLKSLKRKCKEVRKVLENKYGEEIIIHNSFHLFKKTYVKHYTSNHCLNLLVRSLDTII